MGLLKALKSKKIDVIDTLLIAVRPDYQDKGVTSMIFAEQFPYYKKYGVKILETTSILETNTKNIAHFVMFPHQQHRRRRAYIKSL
jgi:GNAT superfamily N-acetyltransferase